MFNKILKLKQGLETEFKLKNINNIKFKENTIEFETFDIIKNKNNKSRYVKISWIVKNELGGVLLEKQKKEIFYTLENFLKSEKGA